MKISRKFLSVGIVTFIIMTIMGFVTFISLNKQNSTLQHIIEVQNLKQKKISDIKYNLEEINSNIYMLVTYSATEYGTYETNEKISELTLQQMEEVELIVQELEANSELEQEFVEKLVAGFTSFDENAAIVLEMAMFDSSAAVAVIGVSEEQYLNIKTLVKEYEEYIAKESNMIKDEATKNMSKYIKIYIISVVAAFLIISITLYIIYRSVSSPINMVSNESSKLAEGDLTISLKSHSKDEIGQMNINLNKFIDKLGSVIGSIKDETKNIVNFSENVSKQMKVISNGSMEQLEKKSDLSQGIDQIKKGMETVLFSVKNQASSTEEMAASIAEVSQTMTDMSKTAEHTITLSQEVSKSAEAGFQLIEETLGEMQNLKKDAQQIDEKLINLQSITEQTNLLALNAAIEAARAGEAGRGFSVVADEVKKLSQTSKEFTDTIFQLNESMKKNVENSSVVSVKTKEKIQEIQTQVNKSNEQIRAITQSVEEQVTSIEEINAGTKNLASDSSEIEKQAMEQVNIIQEINLVLEDISQIIEINTSSTQETTVSSYELSEISKKLDSLVDYFKI